jgi:pimeloyl-ACP methyl ester carboxylesterase
MIRIRNVARILAAASLCLAGLATAQTAAPNTIGVVVMHGKGGSPTRHVSGLASFLGQKGILVANLDMPWSGRREYDVPVEAAEKEVDAALAAMRAQGAGKLFVIGHSQGGVFAIHYGSKHPVDGVIAIAPGGNVANPVFRKELGPMVEKVRQLIAEGKGNQRLRLNDYESSKGTLTVTTTPAAYLSWFDPEGAMNQLKSSKALSPQTPVLFVAPKNDYPGLVRVKSMMFEALPKHPLTRMVEPDASHLEAPSAAREEIVRWIAEVSSAPVQR